MNVILSLLTYLLLNLKPLSLIMNKLGVKYPERNKIINLHYKRDKKCRLRKNLNREEIYDAAGLNGCN